MKPRGLGLLLATVLALVARTASAHTVGISRGDYLWKEGTLWVGVSFARQELATALPHWLPRGEGDLVGFETHREDLGRWLTERLAVTSEGASCPPSFGGMRFDGDGLALAIAFACERKSANLDIDVRFPADLARGHRHLVSLTSGADLFEDVASATRARLRFELTAPPKAPHAAPLFGPLLGMGVEHILTGFDHLLFLLGLVLVGRPIRSLVGAVTAFTLAHSITLALAAFDVWAPSARLVEPCIALSVAYVGVENWFVRDGRGRWKLTFVFGLVHGFGFAGALREIALPPTGLATSLFAFNLGVELGQIAVLLVLLPLVLAVRKTELWSRIGMRACTSTIALSGVVWFFGRLQSAT